MSDLGNRPTGRGTGSDRNRRTSSNNSPRPTPALRNASDIERTIAQIKQETSQDELVDLFHERTPENVKEAAEKRLIEYIIPNADYDLVDLFHERTPENVKEAAEKRLIEYIIPQESNILRLQLLVRSKDNITLPRDVQEAAKNRLITDLIPQENRILRLQLLLKFKERPPSNGQLQYIKHHLPPEVASSAEERLQTLESNIPMIPNNIPEWEPTKEMPIQNTECPITGEVPENPVYIIDEENNSRHQFERVELEAWFTRSNKNPLNNREVTTDMIRRPKKQNDV